MGINGRFCLPACSQMRTMYLSNCKATCGSGGTVKDGVIEVQGDHVERVMEALKKQGFTVKRAGG